MRGEVETLTGHERPLIALDWHRTLSFDDTNEGKNHGVSERTAQLLREIEDRGFDLCIIMFCFQPRHSTSGCPACRVELSRPFVAVDIVNRKFLSDQQRKPSVTGLVTRKAEQVSLRGAFCFIDDQTKLLEEHFPRNVLSYQTHLLLFWVFSGAGHTSTEPSP